MEQLRRLLQAADDLRRLRGLAWLFILGGGLLLASVVSGFAAAADTAWSGPAGVAASTLVNMLLFLVGSGC